MSQPATIPAKTEAAHQLLAGPRGSLAAPLRMLLISVDGKRTEAQLLEIARSLGLGAQGLRDLQCAGLVSGVAQPRRAAAPATAQVEHGTDDLRRLMRAKMFALELAGRMLAGRDGELRDSARSVDSEARFLDWMAEACASIEATAGAERAKFFRERVAQAAA